MLAYRPYELLVRFDSPPPKRDPLDPFPADEPPSLKEGPAERTHGSQPAVEPAGCRSDPPLTYVTDLPRER